MHLPESKAIRTVLRWQFLATLVLVLLAGMFGGIHGAISALLGGLISVLGGVLSSWVLETGRNRSRQRSVPMAAAQVLMGALKAEMVRVSVMVLSMWLVFLLYRNVSALGFIGTFSATMVIYLLAIALPDS